MTDIATLRLDTDTSGLKKGERDLDALAKSATRTVNEIGGSMKRIGTGLTVGVTAPLAAFGYTAFQAAVESKEAFAQVEARLKSMGDASGRTAEQLDKSAKELQRLSNFDDDDILRDVTANLLTFGNVSGPVFDRAQKAIVDLSEGFGQDLKGSAVQVGKALQDPIKGLSALTRVGVSFTDAQVAQIKAMQESGDMIGAQTILLEALEGQFKDSAKAARDAAPGGDLAEQWRTFQEIIGERLVDAFAKLEAVIAPVLERFNNLSPEIQTAIVVAGGLAAALGPLMVAFGFALQGMAPFIGAISAIGSSGGVMAAASGAIAGLSAVLAPILPIIAAVAAAGALLYTQWDKIAPVLIQVRDAMMEAIGPKVMELVEQVKAGLTELWNGPFGTVLKTVAGWLGDLAVVMLKVFGPVVIAAVQSVIDIVSSLFEFFKLAFTGIGQILTGDFAGAFETFKKLALVGVNAVIKILGNLWEGVKGIFANFGVNLVQVGRDMMAGLVRGIIAMKDAVWNALKTVVMSGINNVKAFLGIKSPSRLFMQMGVFVGEGFAIGIEKTEPMVVSAIQKMGKAASDEMKAMLDGLGKMMDDSRGLMDRLFPEQAKARQYANDKAILSRTIGLSPQEMAEAQRRLQSEYLGGFANSVYDELLDQQNKKTAPIVANFKKLGQSAADDVRKPIQSAMAIVADSVSRAADAVGQAIDRMRNAFNGGDFCDKLSAIAGLVQTGFAAYGDIKNSLGSSQSAGLASTISGLAGKISGARANGGMVSAGKTYQIGERGPELFTPNANGFVTPNGMGGGMSNVQIVPSPYFDVVVDGRIMSAAPAISQNGAKLALQQSARMQTRQL